MKVINLKRVSSKETWKDLGRVGQLGSTRDEKYSEWNFKYKKGNWRLVWKIGDKIIDFLGACALYEESYYRFLKKNQKILETLLNEASDIYDDMPSNIHSGMDYTIQETGRNHIQDIAIRNAVKRLGRRFVGKELLQIRDHKAPHPLSIILSPGQVPFYDPELILKPELTGWWKQGSVESFYQSNRFLQVKLSRGRT